MALKCQHCGETVELIAVLSDGPLWTHTVNAGREFGHDARPAEAGRA
jgi:hypothetical protein